MGKRRLVPVMFGLACMLSLLVAAGTARAEDKSRLETVLQRGKLVVATFSTAPPFCYTDDKGQLVGFDVDIARLLAKALFKDPSKVEFVVVTAEGRWPAIESGRVDMGIATTTIYYRTSDYEGIALGLAQLLGVGKVQLSDNFPGAPVTIVPEPSPCSFTWAPDGIANDGHQPQATPIASSSGRSRP